MRFLNLDPRFKTEYSNASKTQQFIKGDVMAQKLYRSRQDRVIAGVCGGIANYFDIDPVLIRLIWIVLTMLGGCGLIGYIVAWIIIPKEPMVIR